MAPRSEASPEPVETRPSGVFYWDAPFGEG